jgi:molybdopterin synthase sulfur carrier subunit
VSDVVGAGRHEPLGASPHEARGMTVKYFATIRTYTGETARQLDDAPADLRGLLTTLSSRYGTAFRRAVFAGAELGDEIIILVNGRNVRYLQGLDTPLAANDEVSIFPMVAGG